MKRTRTHKEPLVIFDGNVPAAKALAVPMVPPPKKGGRRLVPRLWVGKHDDPRWSQSVDARISSYPDGEVCVQMFARRKKSPEALFHCSVAKGHRRPGLHMGGYISLSELDRVIYTLSLARDEAVKSGLLHAESKRTTRRTA